jgi:serine/threonine-protein kinase
VYLAYDPAVGREVALKVLPSALPNDDQYRSRLRLEAKLVAALDHPNIVPIFDFGEEGDRPYLVMRYLAGGTLAQRIGGRPMALRDFAPIAMRLAEALTAAHAQGIIHRDLKPSNVLFDHRGEPYLTDFGIAKIVQGALQNSLTGTGIVGTPAYMSPEQAMGERTIDQRSDIYGLGVMTFEALTGAQPFQADTPMRVVLKHLQDPPPHLSQEQLEQLALPPELDVLLQRALAKAPAERFSTALEFALPLLQLAGVPDPEQTTIKARGVRPSPMVHSTPAPAAPVADPLTPTLMAAAPAPERRPRRLSPWLGAGLAGIAVVAIGLTAWGGSQLALGLGPTSAPSFTVTITPLAAQSIRATDQALLAAQASVTPVPSATVRASATAAPPTPSARPTQTLTAEPSATATRAVVRPTRPPVLPSATQHPPEPTSPPPQPTSPPPPPPTAPPPTNPPEPTSTAAPPDEGATPTPAPP